MQETNNYISSQSEDEYVTDEEEEGDIFETQPPIAQQNESKQEIEKAESTPIIQQEQQQQSILEDTQETISKMVQEKITSAKGTTHRKMAFLRREIESLKQEVEQRWKNWELEFCKWKQLLEPSQQQQQDSNRFEICMQSNRVLEDLVHSLEEKSIVLEKEFETWKTELSEQFKSFLANRTSFSDEDQKLFLSIQEQISKFTNYFSEKLTTVADQLEHVETNKLDLLKKSLQDVSQQFSTFYKSSQERFEKVNNQCKTLLQTDETLQTKMQQVQTVVDQLTHQTKEQAQHIDAFVKKQFNLEIQMTHITQTYVPNLDEELSELRTKCNRIQGDYKRQTALVHKLEDHFKKVKEGFSEKWHSTVDHSLQQIQKLEHSVAHLQHETLVQNESIVKIENVQKQLETKFSSVLERVDAFAKVVTERMDQQMIWRQEFENFKLEKETQIEQMEAKQLQLQNSWEAQFQQFQSHELHSSLEKLKQMNQEMNAEEHVTIDHLQMDLQVLRLKLQEVQMNKVLERFQQPESFIHRHSWSLSLIAMCCITFCLAFLCTFIL